MASPEQLSALADQLSQLARDAASESDPATRKLQTSALIMQAKKTISTLQEPIEALMDQVVSGFSIGAILALIELDVFDAIPFPGTATVKEIADKTGAPEELIIRLMRQITCVGICTEPTLYEWGHNRFSAALSTHFGPAGKTFFLTAHEEMLPAIISLNRHIRKHGSHSLLTTYTDTPHSTYYGLPGHTFWEVLNTEPRRINSFMAGMTNWSSMHPVVAMYPFADALQPGNSSDRVLAVDIGGGRGTAMLELRKNCPGLQGQLILQDRPYVLDEIAEEDLPGVTKLTHDFFTEQPVKNAQIYYIRRVMHDWQDKEAALILSSIVPAMAPDSRIIVSDTALPEPVTERDAHAIWLDLMMLSIGGKERTKGDWELLGEKAGLKLVKIWQEPEKFGPLCVVEYALPDQKAKEGAVNGESTSHGTVTKTAVEGHKLETNGEAEMGGTTPRLEAGNGAGPALTTSGAAPSASTPSAMNPHGATDEPGAREGDVDWEERTVVGDREQSVELGNVS